MDISELNTKMDSCTACDLHKCRTRVVHSSGNINQPLIMLIGEAPGEDEDTKGLPFVGLAGQKLDKILTFVGLPRDSIFISNSVLCRPPNNRPPTAAEMAACRWRLLEEIRSVKPKLIVTLGKVALTQLLGQEIKGPLKSYFATTLEAEGVNVVVTYHPSYLLRNPVRGYQEVLPHWTMVKQFVEKNYLTEPA